MDIFVALRYFESECGKMEAERIYKLAGKIEETGEYENREAIFRRLKNVISSIEEQLNFCLDLFSDEKVTEFLIYLMKILDSPNKVLGDEKKGQTNPNRKMIYNIANADIDLPLDSLITEYLKKGFYESEYCNSCEMNFDINEETESPYRNRYKEEFRQIIRYERGTAYSKAKKCFDSFSKYTVDAYNEENGKRRDKSIYNPLLSLFILRNINETFCDIYMQSVIYLIMDKVGMESEDKLKHLINIRNRTDELVNNYAPDKKGEVEYNIFWQFAVNLFVIDKRNELMTYNEVFEVLNNQMKNRDYSMNIPEEYQCKQRYLCDFEHKKDYMNIILEGKKEKEERFATNLEECQKLCTQLFLIAGRKLDFQYLQHVKVVYREVIEDKTEYNNKQARTILRNFEKKEKPHFDSIKESIFLREKISRGFMREKGFAELYVVKNEIQTILYNAVIKTMSCNDELKIMKNMKLLFAKMRQILLDELEELK